MQPECNELLQHYDDYVQEQQESLVQRFNLRVEFGVEQHLERYAHTFAPAGWVDPQRQPPAEIVQRRLDHLTPERRNQLIQWYQQYKWSGSEEAEHFYELVAQNLREELVRLYDTLMQGYRTQLVWWCTKRTRQELEELAGTGGWRTILKSFLRQFGFTEEVKQQLLLLTSVDPDDMERQEIARIRPQWEARLTEAINAIRSSSSEEGREEVQGDTAVVLEESTPGVGATVTRPQDRTVDQGAQPDTAATLEEALAKLENLVGLPLVKQEVKAEVDVQPMTSSEGQPV